MKTIRNQPVRWRRADHGTGSSSFSSCFNIRIDTCQ